MTRERLTAAALRAYPEGIRAALGPEMAATVLDLSRDSRRRFARELVDLVRLGSRARWSETARAGAGRVIADGVCLAGAWLMTVNLAVAGAQRWRGMRDPLLAPPLLVSLTALLACALIGFDRLAGAGAILWTGLRFPALVAAHPATLGLATEAIPLACYGLMVVAPRRRPPQPVRLAYLVVPAGLAAVAGPPAGGLALLIVLLAAAGVIVGALTLLPADPRLAIAGAIPATMVGLGALRHGPTTFALLLAAAAPGVLMFTVARARSLRRAARGR